MQVNITPSAQRRQLAPISVV